MNTPTLYGWQAPTRAEYGKGIMKTIVDFETGELIEKEEPNEIAERKLTELGVVSEEVYTMLEKFAYWQERYETFRYQLEKAMRENNIKKWDNDYFVATIKEESMQKRVDTERLKEDGVYDKYLKLVATKGGLQIRFKEKQ